MTIAILLFVHDKNITMKQIKHFIMNDVDAEYHIIIKTHSYEDLFSNYGKVYVESEFDFISQCYQHVYNAIVNVQGVLEVNPGFFIDHRYISSCLNKRVTGSMTYLTYNNDTLMLNQLTDHNELNNIIYCRFFSIKFLQIIDNKIFSFKKNTNVFVMSQMACLIYTNDITVIPTQHVYNLANDDCNEINIFQSQLTSVQKKQDIQNLLQISIDVYFNNLGIKHVKVSKDIQFFENKIIDRYNLLSYSDSAPSCLFFGVYTDKDCDQILNFNGKKYILWAGSDIDPRMPAVKAIVERVINMDIEHFAVSESVHKRLLSFNITSTLINFSLVNINLYTSTKLVNSLRSKCIYVYDGNKNNDIYNYDLCKALEEKLKNKYQFIYRSTIDYGEHEMVDFYQTCFMGIRLCVNDGNANTVQEMGLLGLPVLHNSNIPNAVPWTDDLDYLCEKVNYIYDNFYDKKHIIAESVLHYINGDERDTMCIFVPMWHRHDTTLKNLHLLTHQDYNKVQIVVIYSCEEDETFCKSLQYDNIYSIKVENRPLSKKFQFGNEFCKIFHPYGTIINGSDDFLSLNFASKVYERFRDYDTTYFGSNFWYVGDTTNMLLYKFTYNDSMRVVGCGRSFKHTLLNDRNWQVFPLDKNSGIDGASKDMIRQQAIPFSSNDPYCFTFSYKEETEMITPMANLLKSEHSINEIVGQSNLSQIMYANTLFELQTAFKFKSVLTTMKKYLFITLLDDNLKKSNPIMLNSYYMESVLGSYFDIMDLRELETRKSFDYSLIFIDAISLNTRTTKLDRDTLFKYLSKIKHIPKVLLSHDIHDYSYDFENNCQPAYCKTPLLPIYGNNNLKQKFLEFLQVNNIEYIIGICDCPELDQMVEHYSSQIKQFYLMTHHIPENIFYYRAMEKEYDILLYGWTNDIVYPFRHRLKKLIQKLPFRVKIVERTSNINKMPIENDLAELINKSWIVISCVSNFSYLVRKYFEIGACGSIPCGDVNNQGREIFQNNMIEITQYMSDYEIGKIISYYLHNKELLMKMSVGIRELSVKYNYNTFMKNLLEIKDNIITNKSTDLLYQNKKDLYSSYIYNSIHACNKYCVLTGWKTNQLVEFSGDSNSLNVVVMQNKSTPGIKTEQRITIGDYILTFGIESIDIVVKVYIFNSKGKQVNVSEQKQNRYQSAYFTISNDDNYKIMILASNPNTGSSYIIKNPIIKKTFIRKLSYENVPQISDKIFNNTFFGSMSCAGEVAKLHNTFGGYILNKDDIMKKNYTTIKGMGHACTLVLVGFYSPHHWSKYKNLFDLFSKVFIIFTGTDIIQIDDEKVKNKAEIIQHITSKKFTLGALNNRNRDEILELHNLKTIVISLPLGIDIVNKNYDVDNKKVACYVGNNLDWYCHDVLLKVASILISHDFYIYKYGGFTNEFILEHQMDNVFYNTKTIDNMDEFMKDKKCSLRVTYHDGEPMTGIETLIMNKSFIFNHEMKYATKISTDEIEISNVIMNLQQTDNKEAVDYYLNRNSTRIFEQNIRCYTPVYNTVINVLEGKVLVDKYLMIETTNDQIIEFTANKLSKGKRYRLIFNGYANGYVKLDVDGGKVIEKFDNIENFDTCCYIDFYTLSAKIKIKFDIKTNNKLCNVYINQLLLCI